MAQSSHHTNQYDPPISQQPFDPSIPSYSVPPPPPPNYGNSTYLSQLPHHTSSQYPSNNWSSASDVVSQQQYNQWASPDTPSHRLQRLATCARLLTPLPSSCNRISGHRIPRTLTRTLHHTPFRRHRGCRTLDQVRPPCLSPLVRPLQAVMPFPPPGSPDEVQETHTGTEAEAQVTRRSESIGVPVVR